jgi:hypothetical protein
MLQNKNRFGLKKVYVFFSSICIFLVHLPFSFAKGRAIPASLPTSTNVIASPPDTATINNTIKNSVPGFSDSIFTNIANTTITTTAAIYQDLKLNVLGLSQQAFQYAIQGMQYLKEQGRLANEKIISIADFSLPSSRKRLFVIDLEKNKVLFQTYVAHGMNSGQEMANEFSNVPESNKSSLGFYKTMQTYIGKHGYSLHLQGLERGINDNAYNRDIVVHGASYVSQEYVSMQGYIGRSQGCPAIPEKIHRPVIDKIKNGTCLFIYSPNKSYRINSRILKEAKVLAENVN